MKHATDSAGLGPDLLLSSHEYCICVMIYLGPINRPNKVYQDNKRILTTLICTQNTLYSPK